MDLPCHSLYVLSFETSQGFIRHHLGERERGAACSIRLLFDRERDGERGRELVSWGARGCPREGKFFSASSFHVLCKLIY